MNNSQNLAVFCREQLARSIGDDDQDTKDMVREYLNYFYRTVGELRLAIETRNTVTVMRVAHRLKAASATVGAMQVAAACEAIEHYSEKENFVKVAANKISLNAAYKDFREAALQYLYENANDVSPY